MTTAVEQVSDLVAGTRASRFGLESPQTRQLTNYVAVTAADGIFGGTRATALAEITDGTSQTLSVVEARNHAVHWMQPDDITARFRCAAFRGVR